MAQMQTRCFSKNATYTSVRNEVIVAIILLIDAKIWTKSETVQG